MITVANVKTFQLHSGSPQTAVVYIGRPMPGRRGSPLRSPFKLAKGESRDECLAKYIDWFSSLPTDSEEHRELARLVDVARKEDLVLLCWCAPEKCHGDVIKEMIQAVLRKPLVSEITSTDGSLTIPAQTWSGPVIISSQWENDK